MNRGYDPHTIADMLEMDEAYVKNVINLIRENEEKSDSEIAVMICD